MSKHTPGEWTVSDQPFYDGIGIMDSGPECQCVIATVHSNTWDGFTNHQQANARLIAAAPELLAALEGLLADVSEHDIQQLECGAGTAIETGRKFRLAKTTLAKAKGAP